MRKLLVKLLSVIVAISATLGLVMLPKTAVQANEFTFGAVAGASVKFGDTLEETGLRFTIEVDKEFYAGLEDATFGALITTKSYASANAVEVNTNNAMIADVRYVTDATKFDQDQPAEAERHVYYASVTYLFDEAWKNAVIEQFASTGLSADEIFAAAKLQALSTELVCRPYYIAGGEVVYADLSDARSMVKVANAAVIDGEKLPKDFSAKYLSTLTEVDAYVSADGEVVGTATYTVEDKNIEEPAVPAKEGYTGVWESYELTTGDIVVNAQYTEIVVDNPPVENPSDDGTVGSLFGCAGSVSGLSVGVMALGVAVLFAKKKKED